MSALPLSARIYILLLTALTIIAVLSSALALGTDSTAWAGVALVAFFIAFLDAFPITLGYIGPLLVVSTSDVEVTVSDAVKFASILLYPAPMALLGIFLGTFVAERRTKRVWFKQAFNISEMTMAWASGAWVYDNFHQMVELFGSPENVLVLLLAGLTAFAVNSFLLALVISLAARLPFRYVWFRNMPQVIRQDLGLLSLGVVLAILYRSNPFTVVLAALPLYIVRHSFNVANHLAVQTNDALAALVKVVDERDEHTFDHSQRVSNYSRRTAEELGLDQREIDVIASAALLHDLGKVGMSDGILFSTKKLSQDERRSAQRHAEVGATLLARFPLYQKGANLVRHHHEHFDGNGYPDNLKGDAIPIGARIISVSDSYQAMTEERPYRKALSREQAIAELHRCSGTQFDPEVVAAFIRILQRAEA